MSLSTLGSYLVGEGRQRQSQPTKAARDPAGSLMAEPVDPMLQFVYEEEEEEEKEMADKSFISSLLELRRAGDEFASRRRQRRYAERSFQVDLNKSRNFSVVYAHPVPN